MLAVRDVCTYDIGDVPRNTPGRYSLSFLPRATSSFWEGVDVRGQVLSCVIIDKIPFSSPEEPLLKARMEDALNAVLVAEGKIA